MDILIMRRFIRKYILPLLLSILVTSCFTDFDPGIQSDPVLCMSSLITEGDSIKVSLTHTWAWTDSKIIDVASPHPSSEYNPDILVRDGVVRLYVNDEYEETLRLESYVSDYLWNADYPWIMTGYVYYQADYIPKSGDRLRLEAESAEYGSASAEVTVPEKVEIDTVEYTVSNYSESVTTSTMTYGMNLNISAWFEDPSESVNYYMFKTSSSGYVYESDDESIRSVESVTFADVSEEPLFTEHVSALDHALGETSGYSLFSDRQISGKRYPLHVRLEDLEYYIRNQDTCAELGKGYVSLDLYSISSSYYRHVISIWAANDGIVGSLGNIGLADPVFTASNVSTGAGVVAAATKCSYRLYLEEIISDMQ